MDCLRFELESKMMSCEKKKKSAEIEKNLCVQSSQMHSTEAAQKLPSAFHSVMIKPRKSGYKSSLALDSLDWLGFGKCLFRSNTV